MTATPRHRPRGRPRHPDVLTPAEWRILDHVRLGLSNPEIARRLGVSEHTVKSQVSSMLGKLGMSDRRELAAWDGRPGEAALAGRRWLGIPLLGWLRRGGEQAASSATRIAAIGGLAGVGALAVVFALVLSRGGPAVPVATATPTPTAPAEAPPAAPAEPGAASLRVAAWTLAEEQPAPADIEPVLPALIEATLAGDETAAAEAFPAGMGAATLDLGPDASAEGCGVGTLCLLALPLGLEDGGGEYWAVVTAGGSTGGAPGEAQFIHFVAVYQRDADGGWSPELDRVVLDTLLDAGNEVPLSPVVMWGDVEPLPASSLPPEAAASAWLLLRGNPLMASFYEALYLLRFDGQALEVVASNGSRIAAGGLEDLDGDGSPELVLNTTDAYVVCAACGVEARNERIFRWQDGDLVEVRRETPGGLPEQVASEVERALALADADLWRDADAAMATIAEAFPDDERLRWLAVLVGRIAAARLEHAGAEAQPVLTNVLAGEYEAAVEVLRDLGAEEAFAPEGEPEPNWGGLAVERLIEQADRALAVRPDDPAIHAVRALGLARLVPPDLASAAEAMAEAVRLAPDDAFYAEALTVLEAQAAIGG